MKQDTIKKIHLKKYAEIEIKETYIIGEITQDVNRGTN